MNNCIVRLALNGQHTFNPVYLSDPLKESRFLDITAMIRAAAKNYSGHSADSPIWEDSAFNLTKNVVIYCSAIFGYFTLIDIYNVMLMASEKSIEEDLLNCLKEKEFSKEEDFNINSSIKYFSEYRQFEEKFRSGVLVSSTTFLNFFLEYQAAKIFCPPMSKLTIRDMDEVVDNQMILLVDINNEGLAKSVGTFVKLHYERSVLNRLKDTKRDRSHLAMIVADEYQDLVSVSHGAQIGDEKMLAKGREANFCFLAATQSIVSLFNAIRNEKAAKELIQNFRTRIACHSSDLETIRNFKELLGQEEKEKVTRSMSENSQKATRNYLFGGFDSHNANIGESVSTSQQKEFLVTGKEFSELKTFESIAQVYDGIGTKFYKLFLKPHFLKKKNTSHKEVIKLLNGKKKLYLDDFLENPVDFIWDFSKEVFCNLFVKPFKKVLQIAKNCWILLKKILKFIKKVFYVIFLLLGSMKAWGFPNVCSVVKTMEFNSCLQFTMTPTICGSYPPRPCMRFSYFVPQTFIEVSAQAGSSYFSSLPGAALQLAGTQLLPPFGTEGDEDTQSYHARTISVPLADIPFEMLPCGGTRTTKLCFDGMSEHIPEHWSTGVSDKFQPKFLAWGLAPKACLLKGAVTSLTGGEASFAGDSAMCSIPLPTVPSFAPSSHSVCNGWGVFYPRMGSYNGPASLTGALMIASRMKSLSQEVFRSTPAHPAEKWQMISPGSSSCFREGQNVGILETIKNVRDIGRLTSLKLSGHLFVVWKPVSCTRDLPYIATAQAALAAMKPVCQGLGN